MFQSFTPYQYLLIAIANAKGLDRKTWDQRLAFSTDFVQLPFEEQKSIVSNEFKEPYLGLRAILAHRDACNGVATGYRMQLDATASGLQILACLTGCAVTAEAVNLIDNGKRNDIYELGAEYMNSLGANVTRDVLKTPIMTTFYASQAKPKQIFGEGTPMLQAYYKMLEQRCRGAYQVIPVILGLHDKSALNYRWTLPDRHVANVTVKKKHDTKIEIAELGGVSFTFRHEINAPKDKPEDFDVSLLANMVQSFDAYIERTLLLRADDAGIQIDSIFDCFNASPNDMEFVRKTYVQILAEIADSDALNEFLYEIKPDFKGSWQKYCPDLSKHILEANYALS